MDKISTIINRPTVSTTRVLHGPKQDSQNYGKDVHDKTGKVFSRMLEQEVTQSQGVKFSKHAEQRLKTRNIRLSQIEIEDINLAVERAGKKGIKDSLILMKDMAFIVNIHSKVVVTAIDGQGVHDNIFTNIDGAVII